MFETKKKYFKTILTFQTVSNYGRARILLFSGYNSSIYNIIILIDVLNILLNMLKSNNIILMRMFFFRYVWTYYVYRTTVLWCLYCRSGYAHAVYMTQLQITLKILWISKNKYIMFMEIHIEMFCIWTERIHSR